MPIEILHVGSGNQAGTVLAKCDDLRIAGEATNDSDAMQQLANGKFDVVLLDLTTHDLAPIELTRHIRQLHPEARVVVLTASDTPRDIFAALDAGADGYVLQTSIAERLETAIRRVKLGNVWLDPGLAKQVLDMIADAPSTQSARMLPTGVMTIPLFPKEQELLTEVAHSSCVDGVCMVDPSFVKKLRRFAPAAT
jgi:DNA-binding NarL/FixJ family response regulator